MNDLLTKDFIPQPLFQKMFIWVTVLLLFFILYNGFQEVSSFHHLFADDDGFSESTTDDFEIGFLTLSRVNHQQGNSSASSRIVTVTGLTHRAPHHVMSEEIEHAGSVGTLPGIFSHPSYLITTANEAFWKQQFYFLLLFYFGGFVLIGCLFILIAYDLYRQKQKIFTKKMQNIFYGLFALFMGGYYLHAIIYGRMIHYLNTNHVLGESLTAGISQEMLTISIFLILIIVLFERAIPIQSEQDLTV